MLGTSTPPLSSPYFLTTPKTNAGGVNRCWVASTFLSAFSTGFIAPASPFPAIRLPSGNTRKRGSERRVVLGWALTGVIPPSIIPPSIVALGHSGREPGPRAVQPLLAHRGQPLAALP